MLRIPAHIADRELRKERERKEREAELGRALHLPAPPTLSEIEEWHRERGYPSDHGC